MTNNPIVTEAMREAVKQAIRTPGKYLDFTGDHQGWQAEAAILAMREASGPKVDEAEAKRLARCLRGYGEVWQNRHRDIADDFNKAADLLDSLGDTL